MKNTAILRKTGVSIFVLGLLVLSQQTDAFARSTRPGTKTDLHQAHYYQPGKSYAHYYRPNLPKSHLEIRVSGLAYYYYGGHFFQHTPSGYVIVRPPEGVVIETLPVGYKPIPYDGTTYYYFDRTYYVKEPAGYVVITPPAPVVTENKSAVEAPVKTIVVNVPNPNGSYMPVTLQEYSDGFIGPNGEHYRGQPSVEQLKAMYAVKSVATEEPEGVEDLTFDIPNANGSTTRVTLIKSRDGYVGPEGEFYPTKPTPEQLEQMYSK